MESGTNRKPSVITWEEKNQVNTSAKNSKKSLPTPPHSGVQRLEPDVVPHSTLIESLSSDKEVAMCSLLLLRSLSREMISSDKWFLAFSAAISDAQKLGIDTQTFKRLSTAIKGQHDKNWFKDFM